MGARNSFKNNVGRVTKSKLVSDLLMVMRKRSAIAGITIIIFFALIGGLANVITKYSYSASRLADSYAIPSWLASPETPRNIEEIFKSFQLVKKYVDQSVSIEVLTLSNGIAIKIQGPGSANISLMSSEYVLYPYDPAGMLILSSSLVVNNISSTMPWYNVQIVVENLDLRSRNATYRLQIRDEIVRYIPRGIYVAFDLAKERLIQVYDLVNTRVVPKKTISVVLPNPMINRIQPYSDRSLIGVIEGVNAVRELILEKNTRIALNVNIVYYCNPTDFIMMCSPDSGIEVILEPISFRILGKAFSVLGTNHMGADVWSQFVWGARSAIVLGVGVASAIVFLGLVVGLIAGYNYGTIVDSIITFTIDIIYFIPLLPLIMVLGMIYGRSMFLIYTLLILFSWPGTARIIRNWAAVQKEAPFVEAARAIGAGTLRILFVHIAPQLVPYLVYSIVMSVPGVIMFEAGVQLIGFGDPEAATWGRMISEAYREGGFLHNAWWWFGPPILGIIAISIGFVLIGLALDEIANPRLRRR
ncbi:MAG: ABC transporter permease [Ignisphaera sp.]